MGCSGRGGGILSPLWTQLGFIGYVKLLNMIYCNMKIIFMKLSGREWSRDTKYDEAGAGVVRLSTASKLIVSFFISICRHAVQFM